MPRRRAAVVVLAVLAVLTGCASAGSEGGAGASTTTPSTTASAVEVPVSITAGKVQTAQDRVSVERGTPVTFRITSDVDDEAHLHGYDIEAELPAGQPVSMRFVADQVGVFELETHESDLLLLQLEVR